MRHRPRKRFGQNFLQDQQVIATILHAFHPQLADKVLEIGPGLGALTRPLLRMLPTLTAIEIDTNLQAHLLNLPEAAGKLTLINADALTIDYSAFGPNLRVIGNLPYNISTPLLFHLLSYTSSINDMFFMFQKEVVNRLIAVPGGKEYGRLSVMVQYHCQVGHVLDVPAAAFYPQPKVDSAIVHLTPYRISPFSFVSSEALAGLVACAFSMRRKTLANNLKTLLSAQDLISLDIDPGLRPEQISLEAYVQIAKLISK